MRGEPVDRDFFDTIMRRLDAIERRAGKLRNDSRPTVPFYDSANWPTNNVEGQLVVAPVSVTAGASSDIFFVAYETEDGVGSVYGIKSDGVGGVTRYTPNDNTDFSYDNDWQPFNWNRAHNKIFYAHQLDSLLDSPVDTNSRYTEWWSMNPDGTGKTMLFQLPVTVVTAYPEFYLAGGVVFEKPDGNLIVARQYRLASVGHPDPVFGPMYDPPHELHVWDVATNTYTVVSQPSDTHANTAWTDFTISGFNNAGTKIVFTKDNYHNDTSEATYVYRSYIATIATGAHQLLSMPYVISEVAFHFNPADENILYYIGDLSGSYGTKLIETYADGSTATVLYSNSNGMTSPVVSPDGSQIIVWDAVTHNLILVQADGSGSSALTTVGNMGGPARYAWSPDGTKVFALATNTDAVASPLVVIDVATTTMTTIYTGTAPFYSSGMLWARHRSLYY